MEIPANTKINEKGHLVIGGCDVVDLAKQFGTPLYVLDETYFRERCRLYLDAFTKYGEAEVIYASKSLSTLAVCRLVNETGLGLDIVSGGELYTALKAGFPLERIYFHGNNKSRTELEMAVKAGVGRIIVDNFYELELLKDISAKAGYEITVLLRITPGIEAHSHEYIRTGQIDSKFGFTMPNGDALKAFKQAANIKNLKVVGVHCHIGSQILSLDSYRYAAEVMMNFVKEVSIQVGITLKELNLGGGLGIRYTGEEEPPLIEDYAKKVMLTIQREAEKHELPVPKVIIEPGRSISGPSGITLYTVGSTKDIPGIRKYVAVDGGMTDNIRPALYQARYEGIIANKATEQPSELFSIAGKCCESGDMLIKDIKLPPVEPGDILAIFTTGAYGYSMANNYNRLTKPAMVMVAKGEAYLIVRRETYQDLISHDLIPKHLQKK